MQVIEPQDMARVSAEIMGDPNIQPSWDGLGFCRWNKNTKRNEPWHPESDRNHAAVFRDWVIENVGGMAYVEHLSVVVGKGNPLCTATPAQETLAAILAYREHVQQTSNK